MAKKADVTQLLLDWRAGDETARERLIPLVYESLRRLAKKHFAAERRGQTLQPTALVHEIYLKLVDQEQAPGRNRVHFYAIAASMMRRVLVSQGRKRHAAKRGGDAIHLAFDEALGQAVGGGDRDVMAVDQALRSLAQRYPRQERVVELRFFGGLTIDETADVLGVSPGTVKLDWKMARAFLFREMSRK